MLLLSLELPEEEPCVHVSFDRSGWRFALGFKLKIFTLKELCGTLLYKELLLMHSEGV